MEAIYRNGIYNQYQIYAAWRSLAYLGLMCGMYPVLGHRELWDSTNKFEILVCLKSSFLEFTLK